MCWGRQSAAQQGRASLLGCLSLRSLSVRCWHGQGTAAGLDVRLLHGATGAHQGLHLHCIGTLRPECKLSWLRECLFGSSIVFVPGLASPLQVCAGHGSVSVRKDMTSLRTILLSSCELSSRQNHCGMSEAMRLQAWRWNKMLSGKPAGSYSVSQAQLW